MTKNTDFSELAQKNNKTDINKPLGARRILFSEFPHYTISSFQQQQKCDMKTNCDMKTEGKITSIETVPEEA